jgi:hypothetical protein
MDAKKELVAKAGRGRRSPAFSWRRALLAAVCAALGAALAAHYPLLPWLACTLFALACAAFFRWPDSWLVVVPALLPLIGLAPWTGWFTFEELDMLVLAAAAGGYARQALPAKAGAQQALRGHTISPLPLVLLGLFAVSTLVALQRGVADAGGWHFGWFQGYHEPLNSLRVGKSFFLALLVLPLWRRALARRGAQASHWLAIGLSLGLTASALTTVWERQAFVGLFNFSTDYRTTGLFWEMHVGGAALDGFLTLLVPFAVCGLFAAQSRLRWGAAVACLSLAGYACLTTFSRGVYMSVPVGVAVAGGLCMLAARRQATQAGAGHARVPTHLLPGVLLLLGFAAAVWWTFPAIGYRGLLALLGAALVLLPLAAPLRAFKMADWLVGAVAAGLLCVAVGGVALAVPKGAYLAYALSLPFTLLMLFVSQRRSGRRHSGLAAQLALAGYAAVLFSVGLVANHWGYALGLTTVLPVLFGMAVLGPVAALVPTSLWPAQMRWQATVLAAMVMVGCIVGIFFGGSYMKERFSTSSSDLDGRIAHWEQGWDMLDGPLDKLLGKGMGRYPASYFLVGAASEHPGDYRLASQNGQPYLVLGGGRQAYMGWGEVLRISQRIAAPAGPVQVSLKLRAAKPVDLQLEVCEKHLLYNAGCLLGGVNFKPTGSDWQTLRLPLTGGPADGGDWYAPRLVVFSIATSTALGLVDVADIHLTDAAGRELLDNGDFAQDLRRWSFSSDRNHMPWHIKNLLMNVLFDQGLAGLALFLALVAAAVWRVALGKAKDHPLAPGIAGGLVGFVVVGLFDSLLDVPRLAFVFYLVLLLGLTVRPARAPQSQHKQPL